MDSISGEFLVTLTSINAFVATPNTMEMPPMAAFAKALQSFAPFRGT